MISLVTGATGMLGTHVMLELLSRGIKVRALYRSTASQSMVQKIFDFYQSSNLYAQIEWVDGDVLDIPSLHEAMQCCDVVYHCAAVVSYHRKDRNEMYTINIEGTANIVNVCLDLGIAQLCHVSSIAAIGRTADGQTLSEKNEWENSSLNTHYGITKYLSEMEVWRGIQEGLHAVIVNPGFIIGPGDPHRSSTNVFSKINEGLPAYPPGGTGFVSASDVARAMVDLVQKKINGQRYILVSESLSMHQVFNSIGAALGKKHMTRIATPTLLFMGRVVEFLKEIFTGKKALVTKETTRNAQVRFYYNTEKISKKLNFEFQPIDAAVEQAARFFKSL